MILSYKEYLKLCEEGGLPPHNILSLLELRDARREAVEIAKWNKKKARMQELHPDIDWDEGMQSWIDKRHEKRVSHMLNALMYAEVAAGFEPEFEEFLRRQYTKSGLELPAI